jgi:hypothetical protein
LAFNDVAEIFFKKLVKGVPKNLAKEAPKNHTCQ